MTDSGNEEAKLAEELFDAFSRFDRAAHAGRFSMLKRIAKPGQVFVLMNLKKQGPSDGSGLRVTEIAKALGVTPSSVTQIVTDLEAKGLVQRSMDNSDRRAVRVRLTEEGDSFVEDFQSPYLPVLDALVGTLGREKSRQLVDLLTEANVFLIDAAKAAREAQAERPGPDDKEHPEK
jgi:DNA-binding MarR family transcriptional regulator